MVSTWARFSFSISEHRVPDHAFFLGSGAPFSPFSRSVPQLSGGIHIPGTPAVQDHLLPRTCLSPCCVLSFLSVLSQVLSPFLSSSPSKGRLWSVLCQVVSPVTHFLSHFPVSKGLTTLPHFFSFLCVFTRASRCVAQAGLECSGGIMTY